MEKNELRQLPPEIWSYILTSIEDFDDIIKLKFVNTLFYQELNSRDPFNAFDRSIKLSKETLQYFLQADVSYSLPRYQLLDALQHKLISSDIKTVVAGKQDAGKTSLFVYFMEGDYRDDYHGGSSASFRTKRLVDPDGVTAKFELWDTAGQERYTNLPPMYYRGAGAVLLCFSIDNRESLVSLLTSSLPAITQTYASFSPPKRPVMYLLGLKSDLEDQRQVSTKQAKVSHVLLFDKSPRDFVHLSSKFLQICDVAIARALKLKYFECSAKRGQNVNEVFAQLKDDVLSGRVPVQEVNRPEAEAPERRWCSIQ